MKEVNGLPVYEEGDICALDEYSATMAQKVHQKIGSAKYDDTEVKGDIEEIHGTNEEQYKEIATLRNSVINLKDYMDNMLPNGQASGEDITINDSAKYPCVVEVEGNSWQKTREGYNLLNVDKEFTVKRSSAVMDLALEPATYTIKFDDVETSDSNVTSYVCLFLLDDTEVAYLHITKAEKKKTFTLKSTTNKFRIWSADSDSESIGVTTTYKNLMLYAGNENKEYEEYGASPSTAYPSNLEAVGDRGSVKISVENQNETEEQNVTFPFAEGQKLLKNGKLGDTGIIQNRKRFTLDGTESWFLSTLNTYQWFGLNRTGIKAGNEFICSHLKNYERIGNYEGIANHNTANRVYIAIEGITTVEQLKTYLSEQNSAGTPITIEYELAEPETVTYTETQKTAKAEIDKLKTYKGVTHITTDSRAILDVSYKKDLETLINNLSNAGEG